MDVHIDEAVKEIYIYDLGKDAVELNILFEEDKEIFVVLNKKETKKLIFKLSKYFMGK